MDYESYSEKIFRALEDAGTPLLAESIAIRSGLGKKTVDVVSGEMVADGVLVLDSNGKLSLFGSGAATQRKSDCVLSRGEKTLRKAMRAISHSDSLADAKAIAAKEIGRLNSPGYP
jgi:hypothetical protein